MPTICRFRKLLDLHLANDEITDRGVEHLKQLPKLRSLVLEGTKLTDASVPVLASIKTLNLLNIKGSLVTPKGCGELRARLPKCEIVY